MSKHPLPPLPCMCANFRRAGRIITHLYDEQLRPTGLHATQFTVLQALSLAGERTQGELGRMLALDSTTLTRTLAIMKRRRWIERQHGKDRREWRFRLSRAGELQLRHALPHWKKAQAQLQRQLGESQWNTLLNSLQHVTSTVTE